MAGHYAKCNTSTLREQNNIMQCRREVPSQGHSNYWKFCKAWTSAFEICEHRDRHTGTLIARVRTPTRGEGTIPVGLDL